MFEFKRKLMVAVMLISGIIVFMSCEKEEQYEETKTKEDIALVFIQNASSINEKVKSYLSNKTEAEVEKIKENINNENFALSFLQNANITETELNSLINTSKEFNREIERSSLSDTEIKMMLLPSSVNLTRSTRNCAEFRAKRSTITRNSSFKFLLCGVAATGGPLAAAACVAAVGVDFSQSMLELERDYPNCVE